MSYKFLSSFVCLSSLSCLLFASPSATASISMPQDSIGVERKGSKILVLYKVGSGETLSSISRKYKTTVDAIKAENSIGGNGLKLGQVIKVPFTEKPPVSLASKKVHTVESAQTLYSIARMYNVSTEDIKKWNNLASNEISLGQQLIVSGSKDESPSTAQATQATQQAGASKEQTNEAGQKVHIVEASQGLFSIARMYNLPVEDLRRWNNLNNDNLKVGQELVLEEPKQAVQSTATQPVAQAPEDTVEAVNQPAIAENSAETANKTSQQMPAEESQPQLVTPQASAGQPQAKQPDRSTAARQEKTEEKPSENTYTIANTSGYVRKIESGLAEVIASGNSNSDMFLALHRTAPVGTIMQIRNQMNDLSVFVKVIGKLPDTGANDKVIVKISQRAYERLAAVDKRFRVELSYMP